MSRATLEGLEQRLDGIVAEARRREEHRLALAGATPADHAARMAAVRARLNDWRERATGAVLRDAVK